MNIQYLTRESGPKLAYVYTPPGHGAGAEYPLVMFLGGYRSDMNGTKASYIEQQCRSRGQAFLRFDYSGHGASQGKFEDGTIGSWLQDALDILDHVTHAPVVLVGSSMGGWIALLVARARAGQVCGLVGIAAAPDFTEEIYAQLNPVQKQQLEQGQPVQVANDYSAAPYTYTKSFYEEGKNHLLLGKTLEIDFPVRLIQGMRDNDVKWETAVKAQKILVGGEADIIFVDDGDHRLSRPEDLELIDREIKSICGF